MVANILLNMMTNILSRLSVKVAYNGLAHLRERSERPVQPVLGGFLVFNINLEYLVRRPR